MALVFGVGFVYFLVKRMFTRAFILPMVFLFLLGGLQGMLGWIMVKSGLNENDLYVSHIRLAIHFIAALVLLSYVLWFALKLLWKDSYGYYAPVITRGVWLILGVLVLQLIYGAFMAGLKAAVVAPTWPKINDDWVPDAFLYGNWLHHRLAVHFIHRGLAYFLFLLFVGFYFKIRPVGHPLLLRVYHGLLGLLMLQVSLGIATVMTATNPTALLWLGVAHQFVAMLLLLSWVMVIYLTRQRRLRTV
jgi:cytochrome c oxidase assembly protein subunit 15